MFEGSPVVVDSRTYIARTRFSKTRAHSAIDCYDADTGARIWRQEICESQELADTSKPRSRQHLLTLAGPNLVYCSHSGVVAALDRATGKRAWAYRYPRQSVRTPDGVPVVRDLAPCLHAAGRVYVAPADSDRIFCLD